MVQQVAREFFIGSNAEKIVRQADVPVLVLKDEYKGPIKNIVFPNTLETEDQEDLVQKIKALQHFFKAHLHIVWINTPVNFTTDIGDPASGSKNLRSGTSSRITRLIFIIT
jgi:hypothetical protein